MQIIINNFNDYLCNIRREVEKFEGEEKNSLFYSYEKWSNELTIPKKMEIIK